MDLLSKLLNHLRYQKFRLGHRIYMWRRALARRRAERQTCPRRMGEFGPWERQKNLDFWDRVGPDRVCSFCGSIHPDDFEKVLDQVIADERCTIDQSNKNYKVYINRPGIKNAGYGAIKYYKQHTPQDPAWQKRVWPKFSQALEFSQARFWARFNPIANQSPINDERKQS